jgi:hypothetical protein
MGDLGLPKCKRMLMRFGVVLPSLFTDQQKDLFSSVFYENRTGEPVYYLDEWFQEIASGRINLSATDEARPARKSGNPAEEAAHLMQLKSKNSGKLQNSENLLTSKESQRSMIEAELTSRVEQICRHDMLIGLGNHRAPYTDSQKRMFAEITERLRLLSKIDKEIRGYLAEFQDANRVISSAKARTELERLTSEFNMAEAMYSEIAKQLLQADIQVKEDTPVLTAVKPVVVPYKKSKPNRPQILIIWTFLGGILGCGVVIGLDWVSGQSMNLPFKWEVPSE